MADRTITDPSTLRALAHPLRLRLLSLLRVDGPATASELAKRVGESSGATSYHLRQLARFGFVEDDVDQPSRRERRWRAITTGERVEAATFVHHPTEWAVVEQLVRHQIDQWVTAAAGFLAEPTAWEPEWLSAATSSDTWARMTPAALRALSEELKEVLTRHAAAAEATRDGEWVAVYVGAVPVAGGPLR